MRNKKIFIGLLVLVIVIGGGSMPTGGSRPQGSFSGESGRGSR